MIILVNSTLITTTMFKRFFDFFQIRYQSNLKILGDKNMVHISEGVIFDGNVTLDLRHGGEISIGRNTILMEGVIIKPFGGRVKLGENCSVNPYCILYGHGGLEIGDFVRIAAHSTIIPANHVFDNLDVPICKQGLTQKGIVIEEDVWLGSGVRILDGVRIGRGSVIAAGAVINSTVHPYSIYGGVPGKLIKKRQ